MRCPNCQGEKFLPGPRGGDSQNVLCAECGTEFCHMGPFGLEKLDRDESRAKLYGLAKLPEKGEPDEQD